MDSAARTIALHWLPRLELAVRDGRLRQLDLSFAQAVLAWWQRIEPNAATRGAVATSASIAPPHADNMDLVALAAALVSQQLSQQHSYLDLQRLQHNDPLQLQTVAHTSGGSFAGVPSQANEGNQQAAQPRASAAQVEAPQYPAAAELIRALLTCPAVSDGSRGTPLVLNGQRLYLRAAFGDEQWLAASLLRRAADVMPIAADVVREPLQLLFPDDAIDRGAGAINWQRIGAAIALSRRLTVITGGPGTGKTTTVAGILALLQVAFLADAVATTAEAPASRSGRPAARLRVGLAAPTGKAAARLAQSLRDSKARLAARGVQASWLTAIPDKVQTLHRLLRYRAADNSFTYGAKQPLALDVLVLDEASMMDLRLAAAVLRALPEHARLVLLGDKDQLSSVEAGMVLGDICFGLQQHYERGRFSPPMAARLHELTGYSLDDVTAHDAPPLANSLCWLRYSHRFSDSGGIGRLAVAINSGDGDAALRALSELPDAADAQAKTATVPVENKQQTARAEVDPNVDTHPERALAGSVERAGVVRLRRAHVDSIVSLALAHARTVARHARAGDVGAALAHIGQFQLLAMVRAGHFGVEGLNLAMRRALGRDGLIDPGANYFAGQPLLVTANDYRLGLFNGDVGVIVKQGDSLMAAFPSDATSDGASDEAHLHHLSRLPAHEDAFAMTVHKAQGSEFDTVVLVLPPHPAGNEERLLTRELIYTAVTRARHAVTLFADPDQVRAAVARTTERNSGLRDWLWGAERTPR